MLTDRGVDETAILGRSEDVNVAQIAQNGAAGSRQYISRLK